MEQKKYTIFGYGKLGRALVIELKAKGLLETIISKNLPNSEEAKEFIAEGIRIVPDLKGYKKASEVIILSVPDSVIKSYSYDLVNNLKNDLKGKIIIHCSGAYSDEILGEAEKFDAITASAHPLQTFYEYSPRIFEDIFWVVETKHFGEVQNAIEIIGGKAIAVSFDTRSRALYHSSAVVASNFLNGIMFLAKQLIVHTGLKPEILRPLINQTIQNNLYRFNEVDFFPITGPIVRKDFDTIENHLLALENNPFLKEQYLLFGLNLAKIAHSLNFISKEELEIFIQIFKQHFPNETEDLFG